MVWGHLDENGYNFIILWQVEMNITRIALRILFVGQNVKKERLVLLAWMTVTVHHVTESQDYVLVHVIWAGSDNGQDMDGCAKKVKVTSM